MSKFINPFTDYGFKLIFGREVSKILLIEFLNDLLEGERVITDLTFLNNEQLPDYPERTRHHLRCLLHHGHGRKDNCRNAKPHAEQF